MRMTDRFFKFPAKVYDRDQVTDMLQKYSKEGELPTEEETPDWVMGWFRIPYDSIINWSEDTISYKTIDRITKEGFDAVFLKTTSDNFEVLWDLKTFENKLNEGYNLYKSLIEEDEERMWGKLGRVEKIENK